MKVIPLFIALSYHYLYIEYILLESNSAIFHADNLVRYYVRNLCP